MAEVLFNQERNGYVFGKGFVIGDEIIAPFLPTVQKKIIHEDLDNDGSISYQYDVIIKEADGTSHEPVRISDFNKIDWYRDFGMCDAELTARQKKYLTYKLQMDAKACENVVHDIIASPGFYIRNGVPIMVTGNKVFLPKKEHLLHVSSKSLLKLKETDILDVSLLIEKYLTFMPGISSLLFYGTLLGSIKPILCRLGVRVDFIEAVVAPSGHLKTSLTRIYAMILQDPAEQEINFSDRMRNDILQKKLENLSGLSFNMDDYHNASRTYERDKFKARLDLVTRVSSSVHNSAFVFMTAETLEKSAIFSALDRMLQVNIPKKSANELDKLKIKVSSLHNEEMVAIVFKFVQAIIDNYEDVIHDVNKYMAEFKNPDWCVGNVRVGNQIRVMSFVEFLFRKYMCKNDTKQSRYDELMQALEEQGKKQVRMLMQLREAEETVDYLLVLNDIITEGTKCKDINIVLSNAQYSEENGEQALNNGSCFILTRQALQRCLMSRLGKTISLNEVSDALHDAGILIEDVDKRTRKFHNVRHYFLDILALERYCKVVTDNMC